ncbi:hypothetical protein LIER_26907 [Lithospermum erythrorhizon]|uniref:Secreted protein n=1 Tax=Lithospermum erythrorhizon TaxID=34254 RepID=A0AAV3RD41_LITER
MKRQKMHSSKILLIFKVQVFISKFVIGDASSYCRPKMLLRYLKSVEDTRIRKFNFLHYFVSCIRIARPTTVFYASLSSLP